MSALNKEISSDESLMNSPSVIANIIWLVGRCIQMGNDRTTLAHSINESKLLETCL